MGPSISEVLKKWRIVPLRKFRQQAGQVGEQYLRDRQVGSIVQATTEDHALAVVGSGERYRG